MLIAMNPEIPLKRQQQKMINILKMIVQRNKQRYSKQQNKIIGIQSKSHQNYIKKGKLIQQASNFKRRFKWQNSEQNKKRKYRKNQFKTVSNQKIQKLVIVPDTGNLDDDFNKIFDEKGNLPIDDQELLQFKKKQQGIYKQKQSQKRAQSILKRKLYQLIEKGTLKLKIQQSGKN